MIGATIKEFKIVRLLGSGGFGEVWEAEQQIVHTRVAIKLLHAQHKEGPLVDRFFDEAKAVEKIKHAGITKIFDVGYHEGRAFLIMEFLEGEGLTRRLARTGRLPPGDAAEIARQLASILEATHAAGIVHRDLKPDNVFLVPDVELATRERVKLLDFGIAKLGQGLTRTGIGMGTPYYVAPEQWADASTVDGRADVYSFGCILFQMCCGRLPFEAEGQQHLGAPPRRARSLVPELPLELDELIVRMLAKAPAGRPTAHELVAALAEIAKAHPNRADVTAPPTDGPPPRVIDGDPTVGEPEPAPRVPRWRAAVRAAIGIAAVGEIGAVRAAIGVAAVGGIGAAVVLGVRGCPAPPRPDASIAVADASIAVADAAMGPADARADVDALENRWVRIEPPPAPYLLGVPDGTPVAQPGFRPPPRTPKPGGGAPRKITTPAEAYEIQTHEVTWSELEPWLARAGKRVAYPPWAAAPEGRARLPATNVEWLVAHEYCNSLGGELPTEEQWEYAARGPEGHPQPWGDGALDLRRTRAYAGPGAAPAPVMTSAQDRTPGPGAPIWDLAGNVQEWTLGLWREDLPGQDESGVQDGETTSRTVRGLPLAGPPPAVMPAMSSAFRRRLCATGPCVEKTRAILPSVGFRCARSAGAPR